jgi:transcriptional regulator with PAS, ATPase and Fis domain
MTQFELGVQPGDRFDMIVGTGAGLCHAVEKARVLAEVDSPLLLQGETGVGKEVFARAIHEGGCRRHGPFVALNCGGLPRDLLASELFGYVDGAFTGARRSGMIGKVEAAHGGTLFLDEIGEMPLDLQPYLLRVLEGGEVYPLGSNKPRTVQFRLITASNRDLRNEVAAARFRMDLFYRISVTSLRIPALRERMGDIPTLVEYFGRGVAGRHGVRQKRFLPEVLAAFARYPWPGNLRELLNVVEAMALLSEGDEIGLAALPADLGGAALPAHSDSGTAGRNGVGLKRVEREAIGAAIRVHRGNLTHVARELQISKSTLYLKMKKYSLEPMLDAVRIGVG